VREVKRERGYSWFFSVVEARERRGFCRNIYSSECGAAMS